MKKLLMLLVVLGILACGSDDKKKSGPASWDGCENVLAAPGTIFIEDIVGTPSAEKFLESPMYPDPLAQCGVDDEGVFRAWGYGMGATMTTPPFEGSGDYKGTLDNDMLGIAPMVLGYVYPLGPYGGVLIPDEESVCNICYDEEANHGTFECTNLFMLTQIGPDKDTRADLLGGSFNCNMPEPTGG